MNILRALKAKLKIYFSGRLALVQLSAGVCAVAVRSTAVYLTQDFAVWIMVLVGILGSFTGYIGAYAFGYWFVFRNDYRESGRSMLLDITRLQLVEQVPNIGTVVISGLAQGALYENTEVPPVLTVNIVSWFGPQKIINVAVMLTSNSLKRAWVDGTWKPFSGLRNLGEKLRRVGGKG